MSNYVCPTCGRKSKLPDTCCGEPMAQSNMFYCDGCKAQSNKAQDCCGSPMRQL